MSLTQLSIRPEDITEDFHADRAAVERAEKSQGLADGDATAEQAWPAYPWPAEPVRVIPPPRTELAKLRLLIFGGTASVIAALVWLLNPNRVGDVLPYLGLTLALLLRAGCRLFEWYNYWTIKVPPVIKPRRDWKVDVLTTACPGEPRGMIVRTLEAMARIQYPHTSYLCDEGNDPNLRRVCKELGIVHVTRTDKSHAKAGNINNALRQATGEVAVVLDPDHEPSPYFLDRVLGQFEDPAVGFVQSVQAYRNQDESFVARAAAEQSYHFYGPQMLGMNGHGTTQAIGANCAFRRAALDSIGGHAPGLAEDMHTSMRLYSKGWKSVYVPEVLTRGLVPSTLPAFYKQQIKWSCGVFDLLFQEYPNLCRGFTWRQRLHFLVCPVYFLRGVIGMLEMIVPLACLAYGYIAWRATLPQIVFWFVPVLLFSALIHVRVQRWLIEPRERGLHLAGGLLAIATWWVYLAGFVCAVFRVRVPYFPTPKEGDAVNAPGIVIPNLLAAAALTGASVYGVYMDSSPTAVFMAVIAMINAVALVGISIAAQQLAVRGLVRRLSAARLLLAPVNLAHRLADAAYSLLLNRVREGYLVPLILLAVILGAYWQMVPRSSATEIDDRPAAADVRDVGGFYTGVRLDSAGGELMPATLASVQQQAKFNFRLVGFNQPWEGQAAFPDATLQQLRRSGAIPLIEWLPGETGVANSAGTGAWGMPIDGAWPLKKSILRAIRDGQYDGYINDFADRSRRFGEPVLISFAPEQDNPEKSYSPAHGNTAIDYAEAWKRIAIIFREQGAANVGWVWNPYRLDSIDTDNPQQLGYADWIGLSASSAGSVESFAAQYDRVRGRLAKWHLPVMVASLGSTNDPAGSRWMRDAMAAIAGKYPEIKAVVLARGFDGSSIHESLERKPFSDGSAKPPAAAQPLWFDLHPVHQLSPNVTGGPGHYSLVVDGSPFYVKGVVYNPGHDWRDAELPLSRRQLDHDFAAIRGMGGNTIRRYGASWSDRNIFNVAADNHLKVMYGFWLPQDADYINDQAKLDACQAQIESTVKSYRNHPGLLGWNLGNEVWGLLKHKFAQPQLTLERHAEVLFVEKMARRVRELDPNHPVFCAQESFEVSGAVSDYAAGAPTIDVMCVNSYYEQEIAHLDQAVTHVDQTRPYLISEFGPDGYWDDLYNHRDAQRGLMEATAMTKAWLYADRWREYVQRNQGRDVGGVAYCWSDRYEGTSSWFGMNDLDGRSKPACAALASAWNNPDPNLYGAFDYNGPKILDVAYPTDPQQPGRPFTVKAAIQTYNGDKTACEWSVTGPNFATDVGRVTPSDSDDTATIELPEKPGWYRIGLKVTNRDGMDETSVPVRVGPATPAADSTPKARP